MLDSVPYSPDKFIIAMSFDTNNFISAAIDIKNFSRDIRNLPENNCLQLQLKEIYSSYNNDHFHVVLFECTVTDRTKFNIFKLKNPKGYNHLNEVHQTTKTLRALLPTLERNRAVEGRIGTHLNELL